MSHQTQTILSRSILSKELSRHQRSQNLTEIEETSSDRDRSLLQRLRGQISQRALHRYQDEHCFGSYDNFLQKCLPFIQNTPEISFKHFRELHDHMPPHMKRYFTAKSFIFLGPNGEGKVPTQDFLRYMERCISIEQYLLVLMRYASAPLSSSSLSVQYLTSEQLSTYLIEQCLPLIDPYHRITESFTDFYAAAAAMKFSFYLDPRHKNMLSVRRVAHSDVMLELQSLISITQYLHSDDGDNVRVFGYNIHDSPVVLKKKMESNWFSPTKVISVYETFLNLDQDMTGLISADELMNFCGFLPKKQLRFTPTACERLLDQLITNYSVPHELDFKAFVQLVLALDDINRPAKGASPNAPNAHMERGLHFFWKIIDYDLSGVLSFSKIQYFFRDIAVGMRAIYKTALPNVDVVVQEMYDMLGYSPDPSAAQEGKEIGPDWELIKAHDQAKTALLMLLDVETFYRYEFRESLAGSEDEEEEDNGGHTEHVHDEHEVETHAVTSNVAPPVLSSSSNSTSSQKSKFNLSDIQFDDEENYEDDYEF